MKYERNYNSLSLADLFKLVEDPRSPQGKVYPLPFLLNSTQCAILSGAKGFRQVGEWIEAQSFEKLKLMGNVFHRKPVESTLRKCFKKLNIASFKELIYLWSEESTSKKNDCEAIAIDGKTLRGSRNRDNRQPHILSGVIHGSGIVLSDLLVPNKKSEVQYIQPLLDDIEIKGKIITADALHTIKEFGQYLTGREADYVFIAKRNKKNLIDRLKILDIKSNFNSYYETEEKAHGRIENRKVYLLSELPWWINFKSAEQAFIIERSRVNVKSEKIEAESHFGLTSLKAKNADAQKILKTVREHWTVENKAFHVRDRTMNEDQSTVRSGVLPEVMVALRNLALNLFRMNKVENVAREIRKCALYPGKELKLIGIV